MHGDEYSCECPSPISRYQIAVVIPAYNEEVTIGSVVLSALEFCDRVYVVNDGSKDQTSEVAKLAGALVLDMERNSGKAAALLKGLRMAKQDGYPVIVMMDGDAQHQTHDIPALIAPLISGTADMVIGSRFMKEDNKIPDTARSGKRCSTPSRTSDRGGN